jgi:hypothetical protein
MLTPGRLLAAFALGALAVPELAAQTATDLADVCKAVGDAKLGQWASFDVTGGKLRVAIVGSERSGDTTLYWFEGNFAATDPSKSGIVQVLAPSLATGSASPRALILKLGAQPAMRVSGQMAGMMGQKGGHDNYIFDWAARCTAAHIVGWQSITVPAGTFRALHVTTDDGTDVWGSRQVPLGLVQVRGKKGDLALRGHGVDAKSSITERPLELPGMMMTKP